ncbi:MAG: hypothetical protein K6A23_06575 [Butyrivibrio sp.]|nr:hypothetical protein [Butyrivibrio sp.]
MGKVSINLHRLENRAKNGIAGFGSYWKKGCLKPDNANFYLVSGTTDIPVQSRVTAYWPDGSVKWAAHTADSSLMGDECTISADATNNEAVDIKADVICVEENDNEFKINLSNGEITIPKSGNKLFTGYFRNGHRVINDSHSELILQHRDNASEDLCNIQNEKYIGKTNKVDIKECGNIRCVVRIEGIHVSKTSGKENIPFVIYLEIYKDRPELRFSYTFLWDADENKDYLKALGVRCESDINGEFYNRHIKIKTDNGFFHEAMAQLLSWRPRVPQETYHAQIAGELLNLDEEKDVNALKASMEMPIWGEYTLWQDSSSHYVIRKKISNDNCCYINGLHGIRTTGIVAFGGENGGLILGLKDFWEKYPSSINVKNIDKDTVTSSIWLWSPESEPMDFRHYTTTGYSQTYYEGFDEFGASPYGIANTNEFMIKPFEGKIASDEELDELSLEINYRSLYVASPEYYHDNRAFGYWSLPSRETTKENWVEDQLDKAIDFYLKEIDVRNWYGMFDYGDFMHTYDKERHSWRYDMGGYAWQNTELVPTLWIWFYFLRSGRSDVFHMAEEMSRHCSEVDMYHFGPLKGLGSRHNVRHWGCPCKEARIAMAGHHRFLYYLTGDMRLEDVFDDVKDADFSTVNMDPLRFFFDKDKMVYPTHARSGPDWSSFCSNWMTEWERNNNIEYLNKIKTGIEDLKATPMKLVSGSDFEYDPESSHLRYIGDRATGGTHLEICQGAEQTWLELTDLLEDEEWNKMLADFGCFYPLPHEKQFELTEGRIQQRQFTYPFMASGVMAYGAHYYKDHELGKKVWEILESCMEGEFGPDKLETVDIYNAGNQKVLHEMPGVSTNVMSQWSLNAIVALDFVRDDLNN